MPASVLAFGAHGSQSRPVERPFPARRHAPAARRRLEFPLLGRGPDDLRQVRSRRAHRRHRRQRATSITAWATVRRSSATPIRASMQRRAKGMEVGGVFALSTEREYAVAERIARMVPAAELVRFSNSGTEAVMAGLRLARAYTGRDDYIILEGSYHGLFDAAMWFTPMDHWNRSRRPGGQALQRRRAAQHAQLRALRAGQRRQPARGRLQAHGDRVACMLIEPIMGNCLGIAAEPEYLRAARELCDKHGVVLFIDEVKTGFRVARGGVQELYGVHADLCTFAKAIANGYPISVLAGRERIMRKLGRGVAHGGTYTAHSVSLAAAEKTLRDPRRDRRARARGATTARGCAPACTRCCSARGIAHSFVGHPSMSGLYFAIEPPRNYRDWKRSDYSFYDAAARVLHDEGVLCEPDSREPWFVSAAHDDSCLADTLRAFEVAIDTTSHAVAAARKALPGAAGRLERPANATTRSSSAPVTTGWSPPVISRAPVSTCSCSSATTTSAARRSVASCTRTSPIPTARTSAACCGPRSCARSSCRRYGLQIIPYEGGCTMMQRRRSPRDLRQPRRAAPRDRAALEARRRGLRPLHARRAAPVPLHQGAAAARAARSDVVQAARPARTAVPRSALSRPGRGAHVRHAALLDS